MNRYTVWAKTEAQAAAYQALGWRIAEQRFGTHHHAHAVLLVWDQDDSPAFPVSSPCEDRAS